MNATKPETGKLKPPPGWSVEEDALHRGKASPPDWLIFCASRGQRAVARAIDEDEGICLAWRCYGRIPEEEAELQWKAALYDLLHKKEGVGASVLESLVYQIGELKVKNARLEERLQKQQGSSGANLIRKILPKVYASPENLAKDLTEVVRQSTDPTDFIQKLRDALAGIHYQPGADPAVDFVFCACIDAFARLEAPPKKAAQCSCPCGAASHIKEESPA